MGKGRRKMKLRKKTSGFTLIELIMVIVILGILAAVAIPRFFDLSTDARRAARDGIVGGVRAEIQTYIANPANTARAWPIDLDNAGAADCGPGAAACFVNVLAQGGIVTTDWEKTDAVAPIYGYNYKPVAGSSYTYNNAG